MKRIVLIACAVLGGLSLWAAPPKSVAGSAVSGNSPFATDAYPGFEGLDDIKKPERREPSFWWWNGVKRTNAVEQFSFAQELEKKGDFKGATKAYDALVREWPSAVEAPKAQLRFAQILATNLADYEEAFTQLEYLFDFYARDCDYLELVEWGYKLVNTMIDKKKTIFGLSFLSNRLVRQHYESIVRRAPGATYVPEVMLKIAELREKDDEWEHAQKVYASLQSKLPFSNEAPTAAYREARARMWLCRHLAYNRPRCVETQKFLKFLQTRYPTLEQMKEVQTWEKELTDYLAEEAYQHAKSYDNKRRTRHAAIAAYEVFLKEYPDSSRAEEVRQRLLTLNQQAAEPTNN